MHSIHIFIVPAPPALHRKVVPCQPSQWTVSKGVHPSSHFLIASSDCLRYSFHLSEQAAELAFLPYIPPLTGVWTSEMVCRITLTINTHVRKELSRKVVCMLLSGESGKGSCRKAAVGPDKLDRILTGRVFQTDRGSTK